MVATCTITIFKRLLTLKLISVRQLNDVGRGQPPLQCIRIIEKTVRLLNNAPGPYGLGWAELGLIGSVSVTVCSCG